MTMTDDTNTTTEPQTTHATAPQAPLLVDAKGLAAMLGIGRSHVHELRLSGRLPEPVYLGRSVRWSAEELRRWIDAGCPAKERWLQIK